MSSMKRRTFAKVLPVLPAALAGCGGFRYARGLEEGSRITVDRAHFGSGDYVLVETSFWERPLYVHRTGPDAFTAVLAECTHRQCQPEPLGDRLVCPCHGSEFGHDGTVLEGPAEEPLPSFPVRVTPEAVIIQKGGGPS